jgi:SM-20-related protein
VDVRTALTAECQERASCRSTDLPTLPIAPTSQTRSGQTLRQGALVPSRLPGLTLNTAPGFVPSSWIVTDLADKGWSTIPGFLSAASIYALAAEARSLWQDKAFHPASVGRGYGEQRRTETRSDHVLWLDDETASVAQIDYLSHMEAMRLQIESELFLGLVTLEAHLALFPVGAFYRRHKDALVGAQTRVLSAVLYLNDAWTTDDGGALRLYQSSNGGELSHDIAPIGGMLVLFLSDELEHEVLPASRERISISGWMLRR